MGYKALFLFVPVLTQALKVQTGVSRKDDLEQTISGVIEALGYVFWGLEFHAQGNRSLLRIYIDKDGDAGVTVDDCAEASRQVSAVLDVEDIIAGRYTLEVSSPGWDRPLFNLPHYQANVGEVIELRLRSPHAGRRKFKGLLKAVEGDEIVLESDNEEHVFPFDYIDKANVVPQF
ncbi:ribosome maturation factor RimP [Allohahella marinimesophila]|uniref:Ribosome maturation factor RimP n=1 Tax=Allohahella marinimesophila TaxID=1054972 RepID=A0ABP7Q1M3_9GAMM